MLPLLPAPYSLVTHGQDPLDLAAVTAVVCPDEARGVAHAFVQHLAATGGPHLRLNAPQGERRDNAPTVRLIIDPHDPRLARIPTPLGLSPTQGDPSAECYALSTGPDGVGITAATLAGLGAGLSTASHLLTQAASGAPVPPMTILDGPRLAWRGLSLDVVRTFFTVQQVCCVLDMMAAYKFNVLHLHLTDDQGWRLEIAGWPRLTEVGATGAVGNRPGGFYTAADAKDIIDYAAARGISVIPEIDMPGHVGAALRAYPHLGATPTQAGSYLNAAQSQTYEFLSDVLGAVSEVFPAPYIHLGGDEAMGMSEQDYQQFWRRAAPVARQTGKGLIMWQEAARGALEPGDIAQLWIGFNPDDPAQLVPAQVDGMAPLTPQQHESLMHILAQGPLDARRALEAGARVILSPSTHLYLDTAYAEASTDPAQTQAAARVGAPFYAKQSVQDFFEWRLADAVPAVGLGPEVAGLEAAIWCETVTSFDDLQFLLLPRLPGVAEKAWSHTEASWQDYRQRLAAQEPAWRAAGWTYYRSAQVWQ